jgi:hypothetical protein
VRATRGGGGEGGARVGRAGAGEGGLRPRRGAVQAGPGEHDAGTMLTRKEKAHALMALGAGLVVLLADLATITSNPYAQAGCYAGATALGALGVGVAKRTAP